MTQSATIYQLTKRLRQIESEITAIRQELSAIPDRQSQPFLPDVTTPPAWVNKEALREQMQQLFLELSIQGEPSGITILQKQMREALLTANELSQSIIAAREE